MTRKRGVPYAAGQILIVVMVLTLLYTYFYHAYYSSGAGFAGPFSAGVWGTSVILSLMTVCSGVLIELSRFWGWVIQYKFKQELLILQGIPAAILGVVPSTVWTKYFGTGYPFNFFTDPAVTGAAGVWFGIILLRSLLEYKKVEEEDEEEESSEEKYWTH